MLTNQLCLLPDGTSCSSTDTICINPLDKQFFEGGKKIPIYCFYEVKFVVWPVLFGNL